MTAPDAEEILDETCPRCQRQVAVRWCAGVVSDPEYVLVADWAYHSTCWDELVAESPP